MPSSRPETIAKELNDQISGWLSNAHLYADPASFELKYLWKSADKLSLADAYAASLTKAMIAHLCGDLNDAYRWIKNARNWPNDQKSEEIEAIVLSNLGYFSRVAVVLRSESVSADESFAAVALLSGAFDTLIDRWTSSPYGATESGREDILVAERCRMSLKQVGVSEEQMRAMLDVAGGVLRRHKMFFAGQRPLIRSIHDGVLYQLPVRANLAETAAMTDEVLHELVELDLDAPGLAFSFIPA